MNTPFVLRNACAIFACLLMGCLSSSGSNNTSEPQPVDSGPSSEDTSATEDSAATFDSGTTEDGGPLDDGGVAVDVDDPEPDAKLDDVTDPPDEGPDVPADIPSSEDAETPPEDAPVSASVGAIFAQSTFEVEVTEDVVFAQGMANSDWNTNDGQPMDLLLDVYRPIRENPPQMPVVVVIHGGGFTGGTHKHAALSDMARSFAERGWVAFSIDYRVVKHHGTLPASYPEPPVEGLTNKQINQYYAMYPACRDAKAAIRWIRSKADEYSLHTDYIAAIGGSAGSAISLALGVTTEDDCVTEISPDEDPTLAGTHLDQSSSIRTIIDHWGGVSVVQALEGMTPGDRFDPTDAPISIVHGTEDPTVSFANAEEIKAKYESTGVAYAWYPLEGAGHGPWGAKVEGKSLSVLAFEFIVAQQGLEME